MKATQTSERQPYDVVRSALKQVELDSSRRVELDDYVDVRLTKWSLKGSDGGLSVGEGADRPCDFSSFPKYVEHPPQLHSPPPLVGSEV